MAERGSLFASVRFRTTGAAVLIVAVALVVGAAALVLLMRDSLRDGLETSADQQLSALTAQVEATGLPRGDAEESDDPDDSEDPEDPEDPEDMVWQVIDDSGKVRAASQPLGVTLPVDVEQVALPDADHEYLVASDDVSTPQGTDYDVVVAVSLEEVDDVTGALLGPLAIGLPVLLLLVGTTTWLVAARSLRPVEQIRREVEQITGDRLDRRVPEPRSRDEVHRLATTMNTMLGRVQRAHEQQRSFVGDASHELRSPLASIRQTAEVARAHPGALSEGELAEAVLEEALRMQRMVEQMLVLTRTDAGLPITRMQDVDLDDVVRGVPRDARPGVQIDLSGVSPTRVRGNPAVLEQVVRNLIDNAVRHARSRVVVELGRAGEQIELAVEDDGGGIAPADRDRVFDRFVRLDEARDRDAGGTGLGLAIVRDLVRAHGGAVAVVEGELGGARFVVRLPSAAS